jgi:rod shape determining protein RodA
MIDRRLLQHFDWLFLGLTLVIGGIGILALYSAVSANADMTEVRRLVYVRQSYWLGIGSGVMILLVLFSYRWLSRMAFPIYGASIVLLLTVLFLGKEVSGSQRWLTLGPVSIQPSRLLSSGPLEAVDLDHTPICLNSKTAGLGYRPHSTADSGKRNSICED